MRLLSATLLLFVLLCLPARAVPRIVGGSFAGGYAAQAEIDVAVPGGELLCGGTLVHPEWVVTAAHCVDERGARAVTVRLGSQRLGAGVRFAVNRIRRAPGFDARTLEADVALLHLSAEARQQPLPLAEPDTEALTGRVLGWGAMKEGGSPVQRLRLADVPVQPDALCRVAYRFAYHAASMLCAGFPRGRIDACNGDSGGPLMIRQNGAWALRAVVSGGRGCAQAHRFGVYADLGTPAMRRFLDATVVHMAGTVGRSDRRLVRAPRRCAFRCLVRIASPVPVTLRARMRVHGRRLVWEQRLPAGRTTTRLNVPRGVRGRLIVAVR